MKRFVIYIVVLMCVLMMLCSCKNNVTDETTTQEITTQEITTINETSTEPTTAEETTSEQPTTSTTTEPITAGATTVATKAKITEVSTMKEEPTTKKEETTTKKEESTTKKEEATTQQVGDRYFLGFTETTWDRIDEGGTYNVLHPDGSWETKVKPYSPGNEPTSHDYSKCSICGKNQESVNGHFACASGGCTRWMFDINCPECGVFVLACQCHICNK